MKSREFLWAKPFLLVLLLALVGCDNTEGPGIVDGTLEMNAPANLRAIPVEQLRVEVMLDGMTTSYSAADFPDDSWRIDLYLEANRSYPLLVSWYWGEHLIMEERGDIFADPNNPVITPDLDFATAGPDRFDSNCDLLSNIDAVDLSFDVGPTSQAPCRALPPLGDSASTELTWLVRNFFPYADSDISERVTALNQEIVIKDVQSMKSRYAELTIVGVTTQTDGSTAEIRAVSSVNYNPVGPDFATYEISNAISATPAGIEDSSCEEIPDRTGGYFCTTALPPLTTETPYAIEFREVSSSQWQLTITDEATEETTIVATVEMPAETRWNRHVVVLGFNERPTRQRCSEGLERISLRFTDTLVNDQFSVSPNYITVASECLQLGMMSTETHWTSGSKEINGTDWHSLTIGN